MIELERTYLAREIPSGIQDAPHKDITDIYFPIGADHPQLRLRHIGDHFEITRKCPVDDTDKSCQKENTIILDETQYQALGQVPGLKISKTRYYYETEQGTTEIDIYRGDLAGLVVIEFEFPDEVSKANFTPPDFCLADVTQEDFIAAGLLAGKAYTDIEAKLAEFNYRLLSL